MGARQLVDWVDLNLETEVAKSYSVKSDTACSATLTGFVTALAGHYTGLDGAVVGGWLLGGLCGGLRMSAKQQAKFVQFVQQFRRLSHDEKERILLDGLPALHSIDGVEQWVREPANRAALIDCLRRGFDERE
eukprot:NODE_6797_length_488_cov_67.038724_g6004_i0.p2 GENE.NODE_6797_length_488_cov_67.038724_g6004_i0~~NODE_6797_length_488_cov_67.038724_g6004_i0.p2  ORF type:complete len:142 (-),score=49.54 NODE_6797_length_488_cov_67.038724_g6004_i0:63-461(-)